MLAACFTITAPLTGAERIRVQGASNKLADHGFSVDTGKQGRYFMLMRHDRYVTTIDTVDQLVMFAAGVCAALDGRDDALARVEALAARTVADGDVSIYTDRLVAAIGNAPREVS